MYLSCLEIDTNQQRGRTWLANPYRVHQRLLMAFPDGEALRVLFRIETEGERPRVIVQSPVRADWERAFREHRVLQATPLQKEVTLRFRPGQRLRFLLRANPTKRQFVPPAPFGAAARRAGQRLGLLRESDQREWLEEKGRQGGFRPVAFDAISRNLMKVPRGQGGAVQTHLTVDYEGYLEAVDPDELAATLQRGIGPGKAFGFGLLSVAPP